MFTLEDSREHLYQWDLDRRVRVSDPTIGEVHFCNRTSDCSLVVKTYTDDTYDGQVYADIPNILLQDARPIRVYAYVDDKFTLTEEQFQVKSRTKPSDYAYTETEIKSYEYLYAKLTQIEELGFSEETVQEAVTHHFVKHPIEFEMTDDTNGNVTLELNLIPDAEEVSY